MKIFNIHPIHVAFSLLILPTFMQASIVAALRKKVARACAAQPAHRKARTYATNAFDRTAVSEILSGSRAPLTVHDYDALSKGQKNAAHELAERHLHVQQGARTVAHPTLNHAKREELVEEARRLSLEHPTHAIYGLGESPSYLLETAKTLAFLQKQNPHRFKHVAFSGSFFAPRITQRNGVLTFEKHPAKAPTAHQAAAYQDYLHTLNLTAPQVTQSPCKTLVVDTVVTGGGLASFLHTLENLPQHAALRSRLEKAVELRAYQKAGNLTALNFDYGTERVTAHGDTLEEFAHWRNLDSIRLVPFFDAPKWGAVNPLSYRIPLAAQLACFKMIDHMLTTPRAVKK